MQVKIGIFVYSLVLSYNIIAQSFTGSVIDEKSKEPIPYSKVSITNLQFNLMTDETGKFVLNNIPPSVLEFKISATNYKTLLFKINVDTILNFVFNLNSDHINLDEVIISASEGKLNRENITSIEYRSRNSLFESGATTLGDALNVMAGVQSSSTGVGISKPVIRGLSGMRVVSYWSGLRIENQQWGGDHGIGASEIGLKGIEVVKGPASILYGADALGGVIHFIDEDFCLLNQSNGYLSSRFETNTMGTTNEFGIQKNNGKWKFNLFGNYFNHADFQIPGNQFVNNSRFWGSNFKFSLGYRNNNFSSILRYHFSFNRIGIPGHTHNPNAIPSDYLRDDRNRQQTIPAQLLLNNFISLTNKWIYKKSDLSITLGNTNNFLREFDEKFTIPSTRLILNNTLYNIGYTHQLNQSFEIKFGAQGMFQINRNSGFSLSYLIPNGNSIDNGLYSLLNYSHNKWRFQAGIRYDVRNIESFSTDNAQSVSYNIEPFSKNFEGLNYSVGSIFNSEIFTYRINLSSGFRAPHIAELLADGLHHGASRYEIGDRNLKSESAVQLDMAFEFHQEHIELILNPYLNIIDDFIYLQNTNSMINSYSVFEFKQLPNALLYGGEIGLHYHPHLFHQLHLESNAGITIGKDIDGNSINLMPQPNINNRIRIDLTKKIFIQLKNITIEHQYFLAQNLVAINESPSKDYHLLNLATEFSLKNITDLQFNFGVRNLLNTYYIPHLSALKNLGIPQRGRNFFLSIKYNFSNQKK